MKYKKIVIVILFSIIVGLWIRTFFKKSDLIDLTADGLGAQRNKARNYDFLFSKGQFTPWFTFSDAAFNANNRSANNKNIRWVYNTFDNIIAKVSASLSLPKSLMYAVLLVESGSVANAANYDRAKYLSKLSGNFAGAIGPMQIKPITATETIQIAFLKGYISDYHKQVISRVIGQTRTAELFRLKAGATRTFENNKIIGYSGPKSELNDPELNFLIAALKLANLIDNYGERNLHQVFYAYNQGDRTVLVYNLSQYTKPSDFLAKVSGEGKTYISRILGLSGSLDIVINDLKILK